MTALRTIVIDDEPLARERVATLVRESDGFDLVAEAKNGLEALDLIEKHEPDLVFIDVEMPELSGFGVIAALEGRRVPGVVFVTAFEQYALKAFDVGAIDYLHKPVTRVRFAAAAQRARERLSQSTTAQHRALVTVAAEAERARGSRTRFVVRHRNRHHFVPVADIDWIDGADNYVRLHIGDRSFLYRGTIKSAEAELDPAKFMRIHRSALVAVDRIVSMKRRAAGGYVVTLRDGIRLRSSRQYVQRLKGLST